MSMINGTVRTVNAQDQSERYPGNFIPSNSGSRQRVHYIDHAGATLFSEEQLSEAHATLSRVCINPHSGARGDSDALENARRQVLQFVNAPPGQYVCIFTAGATASLSLLATSFKWTQSCQLCYTITNHTSVLAMRTPAHDRGAEIRPVRAHMHNDSCVLKGCADTSHNVSVGHDGTHSHISCHTQEHCVTSPGNAHVMLALPLECNVTGARCSDDALDALCQGRVIMPHICPESQQKVLIMLDAAKACQTAPPDLARHACHFVALSFYKIFGFPTGLGALLVRSDVMHLLQPPFLGGGSIMHVLPLTWPLNAQPRPAPAAFEAGTPHYQGIAALSAGFSAWRTQAVSCGGAKRARDLAHSLAATLCTLQHSNEKPLCSVLGRYNRRSIQCTASRDGASSCSCQKSWCGDAQQFRAGLLGLGERPEEGCDAVSMPSCSDSLKACSTGTAYGPVVAFVVWDMNGEPISSHSVRECLAEQHVYVRAGCCCNPGACSSLLGLSDNDILQNVQDGWSCRGDVGVVRGRHTGVVRASLGIMSTQEDVDALVSTLVSCFTDQGHPVDAAGIMQDLPVASLNAATPDDTAFCRGSYVSCTRNDHLTLVGDGQSVSNDLDAEVLHCGSSVHRCSVSMLYVYPVKSLAGCAVQHWPVTAGGLMFDRVWALMDRAGSLLTCARFPQLQLLKASVYLHKKTLVLAWQGKSAEHSTGSQRATVLSIAWPRCMKIACMQSTSNCVHDRPQELQEPLLEVSLECASRWMSECIGVECFLVHHCGHKGKASCSSDCIVTDSDEQSMLQWSPPKVLAQVKVGAACSCLRRAREIEKSPARTTEPLTVQEAGGNEHVPVEAATQHLSAGVSADGMQITGSVFSGGFSNQAPLLFATEGSVHLAATLLGLGPVECKNELLQDKLLATSHEQHELEDCNAGHSVQQCECRVDGEETARQDLDFQEQVMHEVVQRFRANVILSCKHAHAEADWETLCIKGVGQVHTDETSHDVWEGGHRDGLTCLTFTVGEQAVRCKAINVVASTGTADRKQGGLFGALRRSCGPGKVVWGVYAWPHAKAASCKNK